MKFLLIAFLLSPLLVQAQVFKANFGNNELVYLHGHDYAVFSHATSFWDQDRSSYAGVRNLLAFARAKNLYTINSVSTDALTDSENASQYFVRPGETQFVLASFAGQHKLRIPTARNIYISGGNLTLCLCEAVRDFVRGSKISKRVIPLNLHLVYDAIYDWDATLDPVLDEKRLVDFVNKYFLPSFSCPDQNWYNFKQLKLAGIKMNLFLNGKPIESRLFDQSPTNPTITNSINVNFVRSTALK